MPGLPPHQVWPLDFGAIAHCTAQPREPGKGKNQDRKYRNNCLEQGTVEKPNRTTRCRGKSRDFPNARSVPPLPGTLSTHFSLTARLSLQKNRGDSEERANLVPRARFALPVPWRLAYRAPSNGLFRAATRFDSRHPRCHRVLTLVLFANKANL